MNNVSKIIILLFKAESQENPTEVLMTFPLTPRVFIVIDVSNKQPRNQK